MLASAALIAFYLPARKYWQDSFEKKPTDLRFYDIEVANIAGRPIAGGVIVPETTEPLPELPTLEQEKLEREAFADEDIKIAIPRLKLDTFVYNGTEDAALARGPGLFDISNIPGEGDRNVCIAAHRDIYAAEFLNIHTLTDGDFVYLTTKTHRYTYQYEFTKIVHAYDWSTVDKVGYSCVTLQSCDPIGTTLNRIIVRAKLINIEEL